jgi:hypothetical protein
MDTNDSEQCSKNDGTLTIPLPYELGACGICQQRGAGAYVTQKLSDWLQHKEIHHRNYEVLFQCSGCDKSYKSKHGALRHLPKCPGAPNDDDKNVACDKCPLKFTTKRGLSQHERFAHPVARNEKRKLAGQPAGPLPKAKGYGKKWSQEEIDLMLELEVQPEGQQVAKRMLPHFPGKTNKQIRDKRREATYRRLLRDKQEDHVGNGTEVSGRGDIAQTTEPDPYPEQRPAETHKAINKALPTLSPTLERLI